MPVLSHPTHPHFLPQASGHRGQRAKPTWGLLSGETHTPRSPACLLCFFSHTWEGRDSWGQHYAQVPVHLPHAYHWAPSCLGHRSPGQTIEMLCSQRTWNGLGLGSWLGPRLGPLSLSDTHLGLVSMLMYLRSSAAYWAICSAVALSPGYSGSSGAPRAPRGGGSNRATHVDRRSRKRQRCTAAI